MVLLGGAGAPALAAPPGAMSLESSSCVGVLDMLVVDIAVGVQDDPWVGGQALLAYDTSSLLLIGPAAGDPIFDLPIYYSANPLLGHVNLAAGISPGGGDTHGGVVLASLVFLTLEESKPCPEKGLVWFRSDPHFISRLSMDDGTPIEPLLLDLNAVEISDGPEIDPPADLVWTLPQFSGCVSGISPGMATGGSACDPSPTISWVRSDGGPTLTSPYLIINSPITIEWTATDSCGRTASAVQTIEILGCLGDFNLSSNVNGSDLGILLGLWGDSSGFADLNCDGTVDGADLGMLLGNWGPC